MNLYIIISLTSLLTMNIKITESVPIIMIIDLVKMSPAEIYYNLYHLLWFSEIKNSVPG